MADGGLTRRALHVEHLFATVSSQAEAVRPRTATRTEPSSNVGIPAPLPHLYDKLLLS